MDEESSEILNTAASTSKSSNDANGHIESKMPWLAYSDVFEFQPNISSGKKLAFSCKLCVGKKIIHADKSSMSNLKKHVNVSIVEKIIKYRSNLLS